MQTEQNTGWYAVRTFHCKEMELVDWFREAGYECFVPMTYTIKITEADEKPKRILVPAVHNYLFVKKSGDDVAFGKLVSESKIPLMVIKSADASRYAVVSEAEMREFRVVCDPDYTDDAKFLAAQEAELCPGHEVEVIHGHFKGMRGKLSRIQGKHFFIKTIGELGVMLHISRWYCRKV